MKYALVDTNDGDDRKGRVCQIVDSAEKCFQVHAGLKWVACADTVKPDAAKHESGKFFELSSHGNLKTKTEKEI